MATKDIVVVGTGGQGKGIVDIARHLGRRVAGFVDVESAANIGKTINGVPVLAALPDLGGGIDAQAVELVIGYGNTRRKREIAEALAGQFIFATLISPAAHVEPSVVAGPGAVIHPMAVVMHDSRIGAHAKIDPQCVVAHDNRIGDFANLTPGCLLGGFVKVGIGVQINMGATVIPRMTLGDWCTVGAGAVVIKDVAPETTVFGNPARALTFKSS